MIQDTLVLDVWFLLHMGKDWFLRSSCLLWYTPSHRKFLSITELATILARFLVISLWGFFGIQCTWIALICLFLCRVWGHVCPVVSCSSKFCLSLSICLIFLSFSSCTQVLLSQSRVHTGFPGIVAYVRRFTENSHVCRDLGDFGWFLSLLGCYWSLYPPSVSD